MKIRYLDGRRLRVGLLAACEGARRAKAELNRINVFPVPDGDTGTNLALTCSGIAARLRNNRDRSAAAVAREAAEAGIVGARGNVGMMLSHFLLGFADGVGERVRLTASEFATALRTGTVRLYEAIERPVEGTILTVIRETAEEAELDDRDERDFAELFERLTARARDALARTRQMLPALRKAGVVDAGAKGFVHFLEGAVALVNGDPLVEADEDERFDTEPVAAHVEFPTESERFRFCTEALVRGDGLPPADEVKSWLRARGDSIIVIRSNDILKVHIHTDVPDDVFVYLRGAGELVSHKAEDMHVQHDVVERAAAAHIGLARRPVSIVTDSAHDLAPEIVQAHGIHVVPLSLIYETRVLRDGVDMDAQAFVERLRRGEHPSTSQPPPAAFTEAFRQAAEEGEEIIVVTLSSGLSGTYASAEASAKRFRDAPIHLVDSRSASLGQGMLALRGAELAELGMPAAEIADELRRIRDRSTFFLTVDSFDRLLASGRVGRGKALLGEMLNVKPILRVGPDGKVHPGSKVIGRQRLVERMIEMLAEAMPADAKTVRFGVAHVDAPDVARQVRDAIRDRFDPPEILVGPATPVLATHTGRGAWGVGFQVDDVYEG